MPAWSTEKWIPNFSRCGCTQAFKASNRPGSWSRMSGISTAKIGMIIRARPVVSTMNAVSTSSTANQRPNSPPPTRHTKFTEGLST